MTAAVDNGNHGLLSTIESASDSPEHREGVRHDVENLRRTSGDAAIAAIVADLRARQSFDLLPIAVQSLLDPDPCHQTGCLDGDRMVTMTCFRFGGVSAESIREAIADAPWHWWEGGRVVHWSKAPDGGVRFRLWPVWLRSLARIDVQLAPTVRKDERVESGLSRQKFMIASRFSHDFVGPGRYEVLDVPGGVVFRSFFDGVSRHAFSALLPGRVVLWFHMRGERGTLPFPFPKRTGFVNLGTLPPH